MEIAPHPAVSPEAHVRWHVLITVGVLQRALGVGAAVACAHLGPLLAPLDLERSRPADRLNKVVPSALVAAANWTSQEGEAQSGKTSG